MKLSRGVTSRNRTVFVSIKMEVVNAPIDGDSPLIVPPPIDAPKLILN